MAAASISVSPDVDFGSRVAALNSVANALNTNLAYWGKTALRATVPDIQAPNSRRKYTSEFNSMIAALAATATGFSMTPTVATYTSTDYHDFQLILNSIIAQSNAITSAHP